MTIRKISHAEYMAGLLGEVNADGLIDAVKKRLDEINNVALTLNYADCGLIQEKSVEIIDLLKTQEDVMPERSGKGKYWYYCCGNCGQPLDPGDPYCRKCGKKVKWDA